MAEGDEEEQGELDEEEQTEEAVVSKPARDPGMPTQAEVHEHEATHLPYRSWCPVCVAGRRDNPQHRKRDDEDREVPEVMMDYAFVRRQDEKETLTILIVKDRDSRALRGAVMRHKGVCLAEATDRATDIIKGFGHPDKIIVKVDNEHALTALRTEVIQRLPKGAIPSEPPTRESQSNGAVENGVKLFKGMLRVHLLALEKKLEGHIPSSHPVMAWLVEHIGDVVTKYMQGADGKTAYRRLFGKHVHEEGLEFGEKVMYKLKKTQDTNVVLDPRWLPGIWLGRTWGSINNQVAATNQKVVEIRAVHRVKHEDRWDRAAVNDIQATPWQWVVPDGGQPPVEVIAPRADKIPAAAVQPRVYAPRRVYIKPEDLEKWGYTAGCRRCQKMRDNASAHGINHTTACRKRIEQALLNAGDARMAIAEERITLETARMVQQNAEGVGGGEEESRHGDRHRPAGAPEGSIGDHGDPAANEIGVGLRVRYMDQRRQEEERRPERPEQVHVEEAMDMDHDDLFAHIVDAATKKEATEIYELFLVSGASPGCAKAKISELFSPPRITAELQRLPILNLVAGSSYDLRVDKNGKSWNFLRSDDRRRARREIEKDKPYMVVGGPPCIDYCSFNVNVNFPKMDPAVVQRRRAQARILLNFAAEIYELQRAASRHFLHEHPETADSWDEPCMRRLMARSGVGMVVGHQCEMGLVTEDKDGWAPAKKATKFMSTSTEVLVRLDRKCKGIHKHRHLEGKSRTEAAAAYPRRMCRLILQGIDAQRRREGKVMPEHVERELDRGCGIYSLKPEEIGEQMEPEIDEEVIKTRHESEGLEDWTPEVHTDNVTGEVLPAHLVAAARSEEIKFMEDWEVWDVVPVTKC